MRIRYFFIFHAMIWTSKNWFRGQSFFFLSHRKLDYLSYDSYSPIPDIHPEGFEFFETKFSRMIGIEHSDHTSTDVFTESLAVKLWNEKFISLVFIRHFARRIFVSFFVSIKRKNNQMKDWEEIGSLWWKIFQEKFLK